MSAAELRVASAAPAEAAAAPLAAALTAAVPRRVCDACAAEVLDPMARRFRYPFARCAACGPPALAAADEGEPCPACAAEAADPAGRHRGARARCHRCGPRAQLARLDGRAVSFEQHSMLDDVDAAGSLIAKGEVVLLPGSGGMLLACDATRGPLVARLRDQLGRGARPFALLARDLEVIRRHARVGPLEEAALCSPEGPVVLLEAAGVRLPEAVAPGLASLGFVLPQSALQVLALRRLARPVVLTRARIGDPPVVQGGSEERQRLAAVASYGLFVSPRPAALPDAPEVRPQDHPPLPLRLIDGRVRAVGGWAQPALAPPPAVQHHHALAAAVLAEHDHPAEAAVLAVVLDDCAAGDDGTLWGGEFLRCDRRRAVRAGTLKPVALPGGIAAAAREPWRNLHAQLAAEMGWPAFELNFGDLPLARRLAATPRAALDQAIRAGGPAAPRAPSAVRLLDAVAAALGLCFEQQSYPGEAARRLEAAVDPAALDEEAALDYPLPIPRLGGSGLPYLEPLAMWNALLGDLCLETPAGVIAARFHRGLAAAICRLVEKLGGGEPPAVDTVVLAGRCLESRVLHELCARRLRAAGFTVLAAERLGAGPAALALGQAAVTAARRSAPGGA